MIETAITLFIGYWIPVTEMPTRDGEFNSADFVQVSQAGLRSQFEDNSTWFEGDWDGDRDSFLRIRFLHSRTVAMRKG